jgi:formylglycine-generating enzyme required for sulfatase activity
MTLIAEQGLDVLFGPITEFFTWMEQVFWFFVIVGVIVMIIGIVLTIVASVGLGTIVGKVVKKAVSEELGEAESGGVVVNKAVSEELGEAESSGVVVKKEASEELRETLSSFNQSGSESGGSSSRGSLLGLVGTFLGLGIIPFTIFTASKAGDYGFQDDWFRPVMWLGLAGGIVFAIAYQRRRIRRLGKDKAGRGWFYFGLVIAAAAIGAMGSVTCTSLAYIAWQRAAVVGPPPVIELPSITNTLDMTLIEIPAGTFMMGSPETEKNHQGDEHLHKVTISKPFCMQTTEVTQGQWKEMMGTEPWKGKNDVKEGANYPAVYVSWDDSVAFCEKLSAREGKEYRLPTEAEWEYVCRAGTQTAWSVGDDANVLGDYAWHKENTRNKYRMEPYAHQVGLKKANAFGLYDMHGNVFEWCHDYYGADYYKQSTEPDPTGPTSGDKRVLRGGDWSNYTRLARSASRRRGVAGLRYSYGFRLVRVLDESEGLRLKAARAEKTTAVTAAFAKSDWKAVLALDPDNTEGLQLKAAILARDGITNTLGMTLNKIPAGTFMMGSPEDESERRANEHQHKVTISKSFYMQTTEVTQGQWQALMGTEPWKSEQNGKKGSVFSSTKHVKEGVNYPASFISWDEAVLYCKKLSEKEGKTYRLPTEAEWEYACRAGTKTTWGFGDDALLEQYAWYYGNADNHGAKYAHQAGLKKSNGFGLHDMHGNVNEWCHDYYGENYYEQSPENDPSGPAQGPFRVLRGGSWLNFTRDSRSASRLGSRAYRGYNVGFRLVRELDSTEKAAAAAAALAKGDWKQALALDPDNSQGLRLKAIAITAAITAAIAKGDWETVLVLDATNSDGLRLKAVAITAAIAKGDWKTVLALDVTNSDGLRLQAAAEKAAILAGNPITNTLGMTLNNIPAGTFMMGFIEAQHKVTISKTFYMQTTEVTQGQWKALMGTAPWKGEHYVKEGDYYPATYVSWDDAVAYCKKLSAKEGKTYRLPTEAEWEYACRAGTQTTWSFGNDANVLGDYAWYAKNSFRGGPRCALQVGLKKSNAFGLYDMHGNVNEWCHDYYGEDYYKQSSAQDPTGPVTGSSRVLRGGSYWAKDSRLTRSACRYRKVVGGRDNSVGFRLVRELD